MTDESSTPVDLSIKRKCDDLDDHRTSLKKKSRHQTNEHEIPLDLSVKATPSATNNNHHPSSSMPFYDPNNLLFNSSALLYDLFLSNFNAYYQQQQQQQPATAYQRPKIDLPSPSVTKSNKSSSFSSSRLIKDSSLSSNKHESYACSCGEKYSNVAQLVSHLKMTNHSAQLSSTHDEVAKLVRGQDIWLSRDTNPANQILKCLRCSLSFETLPDLTAHMMKTNHFTQLLPSSSSTTHQHSTTKSHSSSSSSSPPKSRSTCLVCSQQFVRELDLVDHLQRLHQIRFNCTTCGMYFENENLYKDHLLKEMHHRNGKANRNRDYFLHQSKVLTTKAISPEQDKSQKEIERLAMDLVDRVCLNEENSASNALSLLQNFVRQQTPPPPPSRTLHHDGINDENSNQSLTNLSETSSSSLPPLKLTDSPLASLEKMLAYPTTTPNESLAPKKKKFDKYRLFAEQMLRSTLS